MRAYGHDGRRRGGRGGSTIAPAVAAALSSALLTARPPARQPSKNYLSVWLYVELAECFALFHRPMSYLLLP